VLDALPEARLAIVGGGPSREELEELLSGTPTVFTGYLQGDDLSHAYASADVFCFPSASETFGNVVLEAMASGLPVIAPRSGGPVDHVRHGENGFLFPTEDQRAFVTKVARLVADPARARQMGESARAYARTLTWETVLDTLFQDLQSVLDEDRRPGERQGIAPHRNPPNWAAGLRWFDQEGGPGRPASRERRWPRRNPNSTAWDRLRELLSQNVESESTFDTDGTFPHTRHE
jgi:hypothetical protein